MTKTTNRSRPLARWTALGLALCCALLLMLATPAPAEPEDRKDATKRLVREYVERCMDGADLSCMETYWIAEKAAGVRKSEEFRRSYFPDLSYSVESMLAEGDRVAVVLRVTGHHTGRGKAPKPGEPPLPPSGGELELDELALYTVSGGKILRGELFSDNMKVAKVLGYTVTPPGR
ncbi:MAG: ester cyclase [Acidobacteriota bacterium]|jgi:predicted ester cyclase